jgi:predicted metal-binding membrane protein
LALQARDKTCALATAFREAKVGRSAVLMVLLFAVAVMDLRWVAALTALVTAEKLLPGAKFWRIAIGIGLLTAGLGFAFAGWRAG